jgi:hypothetical protein
MSSKLSTRFLPESEYGEWNRLVALSPDGSIYSTPDYLDVLSSTAGARFRILVAERSGELLGGIGLFERQSAWGTFVAPRLLLYYNGFVLRPHESKYPSERTARQLEILTQLRQAVERAGYGRAMFRNRCTLRDARPFRAKGWDVWLTYTYVVPLGDLERLWGRIEQNLRRLVQRCGHQGVQFSDDDDFDSFYRMHHQTHERKGITLYLPRPQFQRYFECLRSLNLCRLYHARLPDGRSIAAQLVLIGPHAVSHTVCAGADGEFLKIGATAFLRWKAFEELSRLGHTANDLTDAALNPVTHFKSQLGGDLEQCLNLRAPESPPFRLERAASDALRAARSAASALARRLGLRRSR